GDLAPMHVAGDADVSEQADHAWAVEGEPLGMERSLAALDHLGAPLEHEHGGAANVANVDRLIARVQHEHPAADREVRLVTVDEVTVDGARGPVAVGGGIPRR